MKRKSYPIGQWTISRCCMYDHNVSLNQISLLDKFRKGKRDSSPDKPGTPSGDIQEEGLSPPERPVICNDEILALKIKTEDLEKVSVLVRK